MATWIEKLKGAANTFTLRQLYHCSQRTVGLRRRLARFDAHHPCVFVLSTGRCGTQTLDRLLHLCPRLFCYHEPEPQTFVLGCKYYRDVQRGIPMDVWTEAFLVGRRALVQYSLLYGRGYVETGHESTFLAPVIAEALPEAKFIHLVRDPTACIRSAMMRRWYDGNPYDHTRIVPRDGTSTADAWPDYGPFEKNTWLWAETNRWITSFLSGLPDCRSLRITAEDLFAQDEDVLTRLFDFVGATPPSRRRREGRMARQWNKQLRGTFPAYADWQPTQKKFFLDTVNPIPRELGYPY